MRIKIKLAYDGTNYGGWQIQEKPTPPPTIQGAVETALFTLVGRQTRVFAAGRTDSGVHAHGQVAHFDVGERPRLLALDWQKTLNALLPKDIRIIEAKMAPENFHARKDAISKTYVYQFWRQPEFTPPYLRQYVWSCGLVDEDAMSRALLHILGKHDFASFRNAGTDTKTSIRTILEAKLEQTPPLPHYPAALPMLVLSIRAGGFLKQMVRNIAGLLVHVGRGKMDPDAVADILAKRDRRALPSMTAPAGGLALAHVEYPED